MKHYVIDGYNYLNRIYVSSPASLEIKKKYLLDHFASYKKRTGVRISVVFDAYNTVSLGRQKENRLGVNIIYSREGETADEVMIEWIREKRPGLVIVTSDRAILEEAKSNGVPFLTPSGMEQAMAGGAAQGMPKDNEEEYRRPLKKGNPKKLPKRLRRALRSLKKD